MSVLRLHANATYRLHSVAPAPLDEATLVRRLAQDDASALEVLMGAYSGPLTAYASRVLDEIDGAEEITAEVFVRVWEQRSRLDARAFRGYLFTLARHLALDEVRRRRSHFRLSTLWGRSAVRTERDPAALLHDREVGLAIDAAIQCLPLRQREVFELAYLRQLTYREVGEVMGISWKTVGNQLTAALKELRRTLRPLLEETSSPD